MSVQKGSLLAALCLITLCTASALTVPSTVLRLVNGHMNIVPVLEEPERPQWPAQYQVISPKKVMQFRRANNWYTRLCILYCHLYSRGACSTGVMAILRTICKQAADNATHVSHCRAYCLCCHPAYADRLCVCNSYA